MASPPRSPRHSPPRRPLHERSDSQANQGASPTLRIVQEPHDYLRKTTPYPTHPSHILSPKKPSRQGLGPQVFEDEGAVSQDGGPAGNFDFDSQQPPSFVKGKEKETDDSQDNYGSSVRPLSIGNPLPITVAPLNFSPPGNQTTLSYAPRHSLEMDRDIEEEGRISDDIVQLPSLSDKAEALENPIIHSSQQPIGPKTSEGSLSSSESTGTVVRHKIRPNRASYSAFPPSSRPASAKSGSSPSTPQRTFSQSPVESSPISPLSSSFPTPEIHHATAVATGSRAHRIVSDPLNIQFPIVKPPTASGSWVDSSKSLANDSTARQQRAVERDSGRWNPHLSTVQSEVTDEKEDSGIWDVSSAGMSTTSLNATNQSDILQVPTRPPPALGQHRDLTGSTIRMVNESQDNVSNLLSPIPGSRGSAFYSVFSRESRSFRRSGGQARPTSRGSFFRDSIPAWARYYYTRGGSTLALPQEANPGASAESLGIVRPRTRPNVPPGNHENRDSMVIAPANPPVPPNVRELTLVEVPEEPRQKITQIWSPHLWHDRRSFGRNRSIFKAPSLDEHAEGPFSRRNAQRKAWFIASFVPLPRKPPIEEILSPGQENISTDLEKRFSVVDEARHENARWWRNLNRFMSLVGILIIAAIVSYSRSDYSTRRIADEGPRSL
ncbi:MAG: hypothetical protein Q9190_003129 [Brigantiaea leucoxantha]